MLERKECLLLQYLIITMALLLSNRSIWNIANISNTINHQSLNNTTLA
jgi:hypothetical protein